MFEQQLLNQVKSSDSDKPSLVWRSFTFLIRPSPKSLCLVYFSCSPCACVYPNLKYSFFCSSVTVAFVLNCGEFCVFLCNLLPQSEEWCAPLLHSPSAPLLFPHREVLFHWCTYCKVSPRPPSLTTSTWPISDDSLYTHKQNKAQTVITELLHTFTHAECLSAPSISVFLFRPPLLLLPSLYSSNTHTLRMHAERAPL